MAPKGTSQCAAMPLRSVRALPSPVMLEVTVVSAEDVRLPSGRPVERGAYATVRTASSAASTDLDGDACNGYPWWNDKLLVEMPAHEGALHVEVMRRRPGGKVEAVAGARVPVVDFTVGPPGHLHCLSYRLVGAGTRQRNGIVNISVKRLPGDGAGASGSGSGGSCGVPRKEDEAAPTSGVVMGYPVVFHGHAKST